MNFTNNKGLPEHQKTIFKYEAIGDSKVAIVNGML